MGHRHEQEGNFGNQSFLPEDYLAKKAERRTNVIAITLFFIAIFAIVAAFFVTNQQWSAVKEQQRAINIRYTKAAADIDELKKLEAQKEQMLQKASITTALIERVPRTVLLAELINRMPKELALLELDLQSKLIKPASAVAPGAAARNTKPRSLAAQAGGNAPIAPPSPPRYRTTLTLIGVTPTHNQVAEYVNALQASALLTSVELRFSESTIIDDVEMTKFRIEAALPSNADARSTEVIVSPRRDGFFSSAHDGQ